MRRPTCRTREASTRRFLAATRIAELGDGRRAAAASFAPRRSRAAARLLRRQRGLPLSGTLLRGHAVRQHRTARRCLATDRERGGGVRRLASPLAVFRPAHRAGALDRGRSGRRPGRHELAVLFGDPEASAWHRRRHRVSRTDRACGPRCAIAPEHSGADRSGRGRLHFAIFAKYVDVVLCRRHP